MPESTCRDLVQILIEKGYLVQKYEGSNVYDFYERPEYAKQKCTPTVITTSQTIPKEREIAENVHRHGEGIKFEF